MVVYEDVEDAHMVKLLGESGSEKWRGRGREGRVEGRRSAMWGLWGLVGGNFARQLESWKAETWRIRRAEQRMGRYTALPFHRPSPRLG